MVSDKFEDNEKMGFRLVSPWEELHDTRAVTPDL